jgi:hypothetical protein
MLLLETVLVTKCYYWIQYQSQNITAEDGTSHKVLLLETTIAAILELDVMREREEPDGSLL